MSVSDDRQQPVDLGKMLLNVAWLSVCLGLGMELLFLLVSVGFGKSLTGNALVTDLVQKISWSSIVCIGVAVGTAATRMRPVVMGIAGFLAAPAAFHIAKILHKSVASALDVNLPPGGIPTAATLAVIKALEYAALGLLVGRLSANPRMGIRAPLLAGLAIGIVFGGTVLALFKVGNPSAPMVGFVSRAINEIVFPVGCSLVIFAASALTTKKTY